MLTMTIAETTPVFTQGFKGRLSGMAAGRTLLMTVGVSSCEVFSSGAEWGRRSVSTDVPGSLGEGVSPPPPAVLKWIA